MCMKDIGIEGVIDVKEMDSPGWLIGRRVLTLRNGITVSLITGEGTCSKSGKSVEAWFSDEQNPRGWVTPLELRSLIKQKKDLKEIAKGKIDPETGEVLDFALI